MLTSPLAKAAMKIARRANGVPESMTDEEVLAGAIITPEQLEALMAILTDILMGCFESNRVSAWKRVRAYADETNEFKRINDNSRLNRGINTWFDRLAIPRTSGDVVVTRRALATEAAALKEEEFKELWSTMFLAI